MASDLRATFRSSNVAPNDNCGKQWDFSVRFPIAACVAGQFGTCQPLVDELDNRLVRKLPKKGNIYCEHIENAIDCARFRTFRRFADWSLKMAYGLTLNQWLLGKVPGGVVNKRIHDEVRAFIDGLEFPAELLVADFFLTVTRSFKASGSKSLKRAAVRGRL